MHDEIISASLNLSIFGSLDFLGLGLGLGVLRVRSLILLMFVA